MSKVTSSFATEEIDAAGYEDMAVVNPVMDTTILHSALPTVRQYIPAERMGLVVRLSRLPYVYGTFFADLSACACISSPESRFLW